MSVSRTCTSGVSYYIVLLVFRNRGSENHQHSMKVIKKYQDHLQHLSPSTNIRLLQFLLPGKPFPEESSEFLQKLSSALEPHLHNIRLKVLTYILLRFFWLEGKSFFDTNRKD